MTYSIEITAQAETDLRNIFEYIAWDLQSPQNAEGQLVRLEQKIESLRKMPNRFRRYEQEPWYSRGMRWMVVDHYCVFYIPRQEPNIVSIIRVLYGGRDIDMILANDTE